jgi:hypothetical protein
MTYVYLTTANRGRRRFCHSTVWNTTPSSLSFFLVVLMALEAPASLGDNGGWGAREPYCDVLVVVHMVAIQPSSMILGERNELGFHMTLGAARLSDTLVKVSNG